VADQSELYIRNAVHYKLDKYRGKGYGYRPQ